MRGKKRTPERVQLAQEYQKKKQHKLLNTAICKFSELIKEQTRCASNISVFKPNLQHYQSTWQTDSLPGPALQLIK